MRDKSAQQQLDAMRHEVPLYPHLVAPYGQLDGTRECHALWYYYLCARQAFENDANPLILHRPGDLPEADPVSNYRQLLTTIAQLYGVQPEGMVRCWHLVDMQCIASKLPTLPREDKYRHNETPEIKLQ